MPMVPDGKPSLSREDRIATLIKIPLADTAVAATKLQAMHASPLEFGPAFARISATDPDGAARFAAAFTASLETRDQLAQMFDQVARAQPADRLAILAANRTGEGAQSVVHGVSALPQAQGTVIMRDFLEPEGRRATCQRRRTPRRRAGPPARGSRA